MCCKLTLEMTDEQMDVVQEANILGAERGMDSIEEIIAQALRAWVEHNRNVEAL